MRMMMKTCPSKQQISLFHGSQLPVSLVGMARHTTGCSRLLLFGRDTILTRCRLEEEEAASSSEKPASKIEEVA